MQSDMTAFAHILSPPIKTLETGAKCIEQKVGLIRRRGGVRLYNAKIFGSGLCSIGALHILIRLEVI